MRVGKTISEQVVQLNISRQAVYNRMRILGIRPTPIRSSSGRLGLSLNAKQLAQVRNYKWNNRGRE